MEKHLLLTLGAESGSLNKIWFVSDFFSDKSKVSLTLLYVEPRAAQGVVCDHARGARLAAEARDMLLQHGFSAERIHDKVLRQRKGTVEDIREEAEKGLYDAVVVGNRGLTWLAELVESSVSRNLLRQDVPCPVWICRRPETTGRDVLLCVDESDHSLRMADHVGFMLAEEPERRVVVLHVEGDGEGGQRGLEAARTALAENGFPMDRVDIRLVRGPNVASAILQEAEKKNYAVVAVGMSPGQYGAMARLFDSPTGLKLLGRLDGSTLWVSK